MLHKIKDSMQHDLLHLNANANIHLSLNLNNQLNKKFIFSVTLFLFKIVMFKAREIGNVDLLVILIYIQI